MPTTVNQLFNQFRIVDFNQVNWGAPFFDKAEGVYIVSSSSNPKLHLGVLQYPDFDEKQIKRWVDKLPAFKIDGFPASPTAIKKRLSQFWLPDESVLYIGKAPNRANGDGISKRVTEFFTTVIGDGGPHSGGQWIKTLRNLNSFTVYYASCEKPAKMEEDMLRFFMSNVSESSLESLHYKKLPIPFANIKLSGIKKHGLEKQRL